MKTDRSFCPRCAIKHLGKAKILMDEARLGYPHHVWFALANMSEAEDEIVALMPEQAEKIRLARKELEDHIGMVQQELREDVKGCCEHMPAFVDLMYEVAREAMLPEVEEKTNG